MALDQGVEITEVNPEQVNNRDYTDYRLARADLQTIGNVADETIEEKIHTFEDLVHWATSMPHTLRLSAVSSANIGVGKDMLNTDRLTFADETSDVRITDTKNNREIAIKTFDGMTQVRIIDTKGQTDPDYPKILYSLRMPATDLTRLLTNENDGKGVFPAKDFYAIEMVDGKPVRYEPAKIENREKPDINQGFARVAKSIVRTLGETLPQETPIRDAIVSRMSDE